MSPLQLTLLCARFGHAIRSGNARLPRRKWTTYFNHRRGMTAAHAREWTGAQTHFADASSWRAEITLAGPAARGRVAAHCDSCEEDTSSGELLSGTAYAALCNAGDGEGDGVKHGILEGGPWLVRCAGVDVLAAEDAQDGRRGRNDGESSTGDGRWAAEYGLGTLDGPSGPRPRLPLVLGGVTNRALASLCALPCVVHFDAPKRIPVRPEEAEAGVPADLAAFGDRGGVDPRLGSCFACSFVTTGALVAGNVSHIRPLTLAWDVCLSSMACEVAERRWRSPCEACTHAAGPAGSHRPAGPPQRRAPRIMAASRQPRPPRVSHHG